MPVPVCGLVCLSALLLLCMIMWGFMKEGALLAASQLRMSESHTTCVLSERLANVNHLNGVPLEKILE